jgi:hypothetical protein
MFNKSPLISVSWCQGLYSVLSACQYPQLDRLTPGSLDWLYEVSFFGPPPPVAFLGIVAEIIEFYR